MTFALAELMPLVDSFMLPFIRLGALLMAAPVFGARSIPVRVRILLALAITLILQQVAIGLGMGLVLQFVMAAVVMAGHSIATSMGLGFASSVDPQNGVQVTIVGQFYMIMATLFFLAVDGHLQLLQLLGLSFRTFPVATFVLNADFFRAVAQFSAQMFVTGTLLALPVMVGVLLINIGFGVMTRAAPQLNIFSIGFPMALLGGFCLMLLSLPVLLPVLADALNLTFGMLTALVGGQV